MPGLVYSQPKSSDSAFNVKSMSRDLPELNQDGDALPNIIIKGTSLGCFNPATGQIQGTYTVYLIDSPHVRPTQISNVSYYNF